MPNINVYNISMDLRNVRMIDVVLKFSMVHMKICIDLSRFVCSLSLKRAGTWSKYEAHKPMMMLDGGELNVNRFLKYINLILKIQIYEFPPFFGVQKVKTCILMN